MVRRKPKLIQGFGVNDADYSVQPMRVDGKQDLCPYYSRWHGMVKRCYSEKELTKHPAYRGVTVCDDWRFFSNFKLWMQHQAWEGLTLDKDILVFGNKEYNPETCCFVPNRINVLLTDSKASRGDLPIGVSRKAPDKKMVSLHKKPFLCHAQGCEPRYQGSYSSPEEAHQAWQIAKAVVIEHCVSDWISHGSYNQDAGNALLARAVLLRYECENGIETREF